MSHEWVVEELESHLDHFQLGPVDVTLTPGHAVAVLGPSGAGKTTLLRTLAGFLKPSRGRILRDGVDVSGWLPEERALGYVPQGLGLFPQRTVAANIRYPMEIRGRPDATKRTQELLAQFGLTALAKRYPSRISGGEQQRVAIARALAAEPGLIVWDEPWQGLDVLQRHDLAVLLQELRSEERIPMLVVTHDPSLAFSVADSFLLLRSGRMQARCDATALIDGPSDAFAARFVGFDNVYELPALESGLPGSLRAWLRDRAGPDGVAFGSPVFPAPTALAPLWEGVVRTVRPTPEGPLLEVSADELVLTLRGTTRTVTSTVHARDRVRFAIDTTTLHPLGVRPGPGTGT